MSVQQYIKTAILALIASSYFICMPAEQTIPQVFEKQRTVIHFALPDNFGFNPGVFGVAANLEFLLTQNPAIRVFYSDELAQNSIVVIVEGKPAEQKAKVSQIINSPLRNLANKMTVYDFEVIPNLKRLAGDEKFIVLELYRKRDSFQKKNLHAKLHILTQESQGFEDFSNEFQLPLLESDTMFVRQANRKFQYARIIGGETATNYYRMVARGIHKFTNRELEKAKVVFEGRRVTPPNLLNQIR